MASSCVGAREGLREGDVEGDLVGCVGSRGDNGHLSHTPPPLPQI